MDHIERDEFTASKDKIADLFGKNNKLELRLQAVENKVITLKEKQREHSDSIKNIDDKQDAYTESVLNLKDQFRGDLNEYFKKTLGFLTSVQEKQIKLSGHQADMRNENSIYIAESRKLGEKVMKNAKIYGRLVVAVITVVGTLVGAYEVYTQRQIHQMVLSNSLQISNLMREMKESNDESKSNPKKRSRKRNSGSGRLGTETEGGIKTRIITGLPDSSYYNNDN